MRNTARRLILALYNIDDVYFVNEKLKGFSDAELSVLYALDDGEAHSQAEISREWLVPKTTVNTIIKKWEKQGFVTQEPIVGKRREMQIVLTEAGKTYAKSVMDFIYRAENTALQKTLDKYSDSFIEALEYYGENLRKAFEVQTSDD